MSNYVVNNATLECFFGTAPSFFGVTPEKQVFACGQPMANTMDFKPTINIRPFGLCRSLLNPVVAAATAANFGILTPMPCVPNTITPWINGKNNVTIKGFPALMKEAKLNCVWQGIISVIDENNKTVKEK